jgi:hypothetical protein
MAFLPLVVRYRRAHDGPMTMLLTDRLAPIRPMRDEEVAELRALTRDLPRLIKGWTTPLVLDAPIALDAALWQVARGHGVLIRPGDSVVAVVDRLSGVGWDRGAARDALRALVMLRSSPHSDPVAAGRLLAYLNLRARFG